MGVDFADYNNDGWPDLVVTDLANQRYALYQNNADGSFTYASATSGISRMTMTHSGWGVRFFDYDNDGWKDLLIAQGHDLDTIELNFPNLRYREPMLLARNTGKGFVDVSTKSGSVFQQSWVARGLAIGDLDNDGRLDAVVTTNGGAAYVLHNATVTENHWILLKLVGHKSNRDAIGAKITVSLNNHKLVRWITGGGSYLSTHDKRVLLGLGDDYKSPAVNVEIRWPDGTLQRLSGVKTNEYHRMVEPAVANPIEQRK